MQSLGRWIVLALFTTVAYGSAPVCAQQKLDEAAQAAIDETIATYCATWGEPDVAKRREMLQRVLAVDATYTDPTGQAEGIDALVDKISAFQQRFPGGKIVESSRADVHHGMLRFTWRFLVGDGSVRNEGIDFVTLAPDGRLQKLVAFFGPIKPN